MDRDDELTLRPLARIRRWLAPPGAPLTPSSSEPATRRATVPAGQGRAAGAAVLGLGQGLDGGARDTAPLPGAVAAGAAPAIGMGPGVEGVGEAPTRGVGPDAGERRCPRCATVWKPASGGTTCPACTRGDDHVVQAAQVLQAARAARYPRCIIGGVRAVAGPAGRAAFARSAPREGLEMALAALECAGGRVAAGRPCY